MAEVTFRGRRSTLRTLDVWIRQFSWQAQGTMTLRVGGGGECRRDIGVGV